MVPDTVMASHDPAVPRPFTPPTPRVAGLGPTVSSESIPRSLHTTAVVTPEAVLLQFRTAGVASRVLAKIFDLMIQLIVLSLLSVPLAILAAASETLTTIVLAVLVFAVVFMYPLIEVVRNGQTLGKQILGIRVVTIEGGPVRVSHSAIRTVLGIVEFLMVPGGLIAVISAVVSRRGQRLGDLAAGTLVVRHHEVLPQPTFFAPIRGWEDYCALFDAGTMTPQQYALIREYLMRYRILRPEAALALAAELSEGLERQGIPARPQALHPVNYLAAAAFAYQRRFRFDDGTTEAPVLPSGFTPYGQGYSTQAPPPPVVPQPPKPLA